MKRLIPALLTAALALHAADTKEEPVGLILSAPGGKVLRTNTETPLAARAGDILFSGDALRAIGSPANFLYCPAKASQTLDAGGEVLLDAKQLKVKTGKLDAPKPVNACFLPQLVRVAVASQQHYGVSMTRGLAKPEGDVIPFDSLAAAVRAQIEPTLKRSSARDPAPTPKRWSEEAAIFDPRPPRSERARNVSKDCPGLDRRGLGAGPRFRTRRVAGHTGRAESR